MSISPAFDKDVHSHLSSPFTLILLYGCETLPVGVAGVRVLAFFDNKSILIIIYMRRRDCVKTRELRCRLYLECIPVQLV